VVVLARRDPRLSLPTIDGYTTSFAISDAICVLAIFAALIVPYRHNAKCEFTAQSAWSATCSTDLADANV
jgi:hypothetical protein